MMADDFLESLRQDFLLEASDYLAEMQQVLLRLEESLPDGQKADDIEVVYRTTHSLKGAARSVNLPLIEQLCISLEDVWKKLRNGELSLQAGMFDVFYQSIDLLHHLLDDVRQGSSQAGPYRVEEMRKRVDALLQGRTGRPSLLHDDFLAKSEPEKIENFSVTQPDNVKADEVAQVTGAKAQKTLPDEEVSPRLPGKRTSDTIRVPVVRIEQLLAETEELLALHNSVEYFERLVEQVMVRAKLTNNPSQPDKSGFQEQERELISQLNSLARQLAQYKHTSLQHKTSLLHELQHMLMFPMSEVFELMPRMVRDIARSKQKQVNLSISGGETGVDRRIIEGIKDPLIHLVRNCIDHGIELPETRISAGKPAQGSLAIQAGINSEGKLQLTISDDGAGISTQRLKEKALSMGLISPEQAAAMNESEAQRLIFSSGLSTSTQVNDISGHGLGMSIVAEKIESLSGTIELVSETGKGTTFIITLPRVLSMFRGILVREQAYNLLIPTQVVAKAMRIKPSQVRQLATLAVVDVDRTAVPLIRLAQVLKLPEKAGRSKKDESLNILVVRSGNRTVALEVEQVLGEERGVVRPFQNGMGNSEFFAGVFILSGGQIAFVMRTDVLVEHKATITSVAKETQQRKLLVVEDSLTIRNLLRNMLETAGYLVTTASDGLEAFQKLEKAQFDAVVTDIEMPRMNGFELTRKIRGQAKWKFLPIVLVTSLDSEDDKRKGMDSGASAYVTKRDFEKGNLLQILSNLLT
ncbi:MAG: response regulator [Bacteroidetes bacterium]|nr:response regulator [Bacteroidota bacterium]